MKRTVIAFLVGVSITNLQAVLIIENGKQVLRSSKSTVYSCDKGSTKKFSSEAGCKQNCTGSCKKEEVQMVYR